MHAPRTLSRAAHGAWVLLIAAACSTAESRNAPRSGRAASETAAPAGTALSFRIDGSVSTRSHTEGDRFSGTLTAAALAPGGDVVVPAGSESRWVVTRSSPRTTDSPPQLGFRLESLYLGGDWVAVEGTLADVSVAPQPRDQRVDTLTHAVLPVGSTVTVRLDRPLARD